MFYIAKIIYYDTIFDANNFPMIPNQDQLQYFTIPILVSASSLYKAQKNIEENYGTSLDKIIYIKPINSKIININNINEIIQTIENQYIEETGGID